MRRVCQSPHEAWTQQKGPSGNPSLGLSSTALPSENTPPPTGACGVEAGAVTAEPQPRSHVPASEVKQEAGGAIDNVAMTTAAAVNRLTLDVANETASPPPPRPPAPTPPVGSMADNGNVPSDSYRMENPLDFSVVGEAVTDLENQAPLSAKFMELLNVLQQRVDDVYHAELGQAAAWEETWDNFQESRDEWGEQAVQAMAQLLRSEGRSAWVDPHFTPSERSLYMYTTHAARTGHQQQQSFRKDRDAFLHGVEGLTWRRAKDVGDVAKKTVAFSGSIDPTDIAQGRLGNCYFLAALASCAQQTNDVIIRDLLIEDGLDVGIFGVKFFVNGRFVTVVVDDLIPCVPSGNGWTPIFSQYTPQGTYDSTEKEVWGMIFEKAWAKLHGSYEATAAGLTSDALNYLTGGVVDQIELRVPEKLDARWDSLCGMIDRDTPDDNPFLSCAVASEVEDADCERVGLMKDHAYSLLLAITCRDGTKLVQLRNPWGTYEWNGRFSDKSKAWTPALIKETGFNEEDDGTFFMHLEDFLCYFVEVEVCDPWILQKFSEDNKIRNDTCAGALIAGKSSGGRSLVPTFKFNPRYRLTVNDTKCRIQIMQPDIRGKEHTSYIDLFVYLVDPDKFHDIHCSASAARKILALSRRQNGVVLDDLVPNKEYWIVPCGWAPGVETPFFLVANGTDCRLQALPPTEEPTPSETLAMAARPERRAVCIACGSGEITGDRYDTDEGSIHFECMALYRQMKAFKCDQCHALVMNDQFYKLANKRFCSEGCVAKFNLSLAPCCIMCDDPMIGAMYETDDGKVCSEKPACLEAYKLSKLPACITCSANVASFYPTDAGPQCPKCYKP